MAPLLWMATNLLVVAAVLVPFALFTALLCLADANTDNTKGS